VQPHRRRRVGGERLLQGHLARPQVVQALLQPGRAVALGQSVDQALELAPDLGQLTLFPRPGGGLLPPVSVDFLVVRRDELLDHFRRHEALPQPLQDQLLERCPAQALAVRARPLTPGGRAGQVVATDRRQAAAAGAAVDQPG
jgi:hypothetical protein